MDSAFDAIALALRHSAVIEVRSALLQNTDVSYDVEDLKTLFPKMLETDSSAEVNHRFSEDFDSKAEMERLQRQLFEAMRQGNSVKIDKIKRQLEYYSNIEGKSVLVSPPVSLMMSPPPPTNPDQSQVFEA